MELTATVTSSPKLTEPSLKDWLDKNRVPYVLVSIHKTKEKKVIRGVKPGWTTWTYEKCMDINAHADHKCNAMNVNIRAGDIVVIDIDDPSVVDRLLQKYGDYHRTKSMGRGLPHLWRKRHADDNNTTKVARDEEKVDILYSNVFERLDAPFLADVLSTFTDYKRVENKKITVLPDATGEQVSEEDMHILKLIKVEHLENRDSWRNIIWGLRSKYSNADDVAHAVSRQAFNYEAKAVQDLLDQPSSTVGWGTVCHWAKKSDPVGFKALKRKYSAERMSGMGADDLDKWNDKNMAERYLCFVEGEVMRKHGKLVVYNRETNFWSHEGKRLVNLGIATILPAALEVTRHRVLASDSLTDDDIGAREKLMKNITKYQAFCGTASKLTAVAKYVDYAVGESDIEFDVHTPYIIAFSDGVAFDLRTGDKVVLEKTHYATMHTGYAYEEVTEDQVWELTRFIAEILPEVEERRALLSVLATGMTGAMLNRFILLSGGGGNGKGTIMSLFKAMLGHYGYGGNINTLLNPLPEGGSPAVAGINLKRTVSYTEPPQHSKLELSTIKTMTGDPRLTGRALFSNNTSVMNHATTIVECNDLPLINGTIDDSATRRIVEIRFIVRYTPDENDAELLAGKEHVYLADRKYESDAWKEETKHVLFEVLRRFIVDTPCAPEKVEIAPKLLTYTRKFLDDSNIGPEWFKEAYTRDEEAFAEPLKAKDVYDAFKSSVDYGNLTREEKEQWKSRTFVNALKVTLGSDWKATYFCDGHNYGRSCIINWTAK